MNYNISSGNIKRFKHTVLLLIYRQDLLYYVYVDFVLIIIILIVAAIIELILLGCWAAFYYRSGIPIFSKKSHVPERRPLELNVDVLNDKFQSRLGPSFVFRNLGKNEYAFREKIFEIKSFSYTPLMHGHIIYDVTSGILSITGKTNWYPLLFFTMIMAFVISKAGKENVPVEIFVLLLIVLAVFYFIQFFRYKKIVTFISQMHRDSIKINTFHKN